MSATTSVMLRGASKRVLSLGNNGSRIIRTTKSAWGSNKASFSTRISSHQEGFLVPDSSASRKTFSTSTPKVPEPEPLAAVAYDYDDDEVDDSMDESQQYSSKNSPFTQEQDTTKINAVGVTSASQSDVNYVISRRNSTCGAVKKLDSMEHSSITNNSAPYSKFNTIFNSIHHNTTTTTASNNNGIGDGDGNDTYPPPSADEEVGAKNFRGKSGGGGGGRYRCPKCGTDVTFKCDFEDNTFYCASCAGWFAGRSPADSATRSPSYEEFIAKDMRNKQQKAGEQEIIMRHVSNISMHSSTN